MEHEIAVVRPEQSPPLALRVTAGELQRGNLAILCFDPRQVLCNRPLGN